MISTSHVNTEGREEAAHLIVSVGDRGLEEVAREDGNGKNDRRDAPGLNRFEGRDHTWGRRVHAFIGFLSANLIHA